MGPLRVTLFGHPEHSTVSGNHCSGTDQVIKLRKAYLQDEEDLERVMRKKKLDFLDILLFARVSVCRTGLRLCPEGQRRGQEVHSHLPFPDEEWK